ncbi:hypothetical protein FSP39_022909 [Pinctada imbricata]|uniref:Uncharacterized protein n=1 Tax=Pinctada imbricata TaxID=66713 RepID=A0AA88XMQ8_PINIB|nr:hypothetical protein FSP39_022909 [Pinctada imbricata]
MQMDKMNHKLRHLITILHITSDQGGKNSNSTSRGIPVFIGNWQGSPNKQNNQGVKWNSQTKGPPLGWFEGSGPRSAPVKHSSQSGSAPIRRSSPPQNGTNSNQNIRPGPSGNGRNSGAPWNNPNANQGYWYMNSGPYQYNGPPWNWNNGPGPNGPPGNWNTQGQNGPPSNRNNGSGQNRPTNWIGPGPNGPPGNWNTQGQNSPPSNRNDGPSQNGPPSNMKGPTNNWNTQGQGGPSGPPYNWNNFGPGNNGPGPNTNWNGPPGQNTNWNGPPGPPMGWNGPYGPNMNWNGPPGPNNWNGPPGGFGPNPAFMSHHMGQSPAGVGIALLDHDLPDGLDDRFQRMQAAQAMRQMGVDIGPPPPFIMPPVPLPVMLPGQGQPPPWIQGQGQQQRQNQFSGSSQNTTTGRVGWPLRPSSRAGFWTGSSQNNTNQNTTTSSTTSKTSVMPTPTLAEFQHKSNSNVSFNTQRPSYNFNYPYGNWNSGVYNPIGYRNWQSFQRPDVPDHLEDKPPRKTTSSTDVRLPDASFGGKRFSSAPPKIPNLTSNMRNAERENTGQTLPRERIQGLTKSSSIQIWPSRTPSPRRRDFYDQRIRHVERVLGVRNEIRGGGGGGGVEREPEPEKKSDGDHETEREIDKEEGAKNIDPRIVRRVLDVIKQQSGSDGVSLDSVISGLNDQGYKFKMKYRYEGSVPAPAWVDRLGNIKAGPTSSPSNTEVTTPIQANVTAPSTVRGDDVTDSSSETASSDPFNLEISPTSTSETKILRYTRFQHFNHLRAHLEEIRILNGDRQLHRVEQDHHVP